MVWLSVVCHTILGPATEPVLVVDSCDTEYRKINVIKS